MADGGNRRMTEPEIELGRAEAELAQEESALLTEFARLAQTAQEMERKLAQVRALVHDAEQSGARDGELTLRLQTVRLPAIDPERPFAQARALRQQALEARRSANQQARGLVAQYRQHQTQLAAQLLLDEKAAKKLELVARQKAEQAAQQLTQQTQPMMPAVQVPPPPPPAHASPSALDDVPLAPNRTQRFFQPQATTQPAAKAAPPPPPQPSKRASPRVRMQAAITIGSDSNFYNGFSSDISDGGIFVATVDQPPIGTEVDLSFSLPSGQRIECKGVVRWVREVNDKIPDAFPGIGVQFTGLEPSANAAIRQFVDERDPLFFPD
jgi:uncharacterized protein (TIGR02266 family)